MVLRAILLTGGRGTRLFPLTNRLPKPLLPIDNIPALSRILRQVEKSGIRSATLTLSYCGEAITARYGGLFRTLHLDYAHEKEPLGTAGAAKAAILSPTLAVSAFAHSHTHEDTYGDWLVLSGDALFEGDLTALIATHEQQGNDVTIAAKTLENVAGYGVMQSRTPTARHGRIEAFIEKPDPDQTPSHLVNLGIYILSQRILHEIPDGRYDFGKELFPTLLRKGYRLGYCRFDDYWCDIGTPKSYWEANLRYANGRSVIGNRCRFAPLSRVEKSVLMDGVSLGEGACVANSILCSDVTLGKGVVLQDCVVEDGCTLSTSPPPSSFILKDGDGITVRPQESGLIRTNVHA